MKKNIKLLSRLTYILASIAIIFRLIFPTPVQSFNLFKELWRGLGKTSHLIVKLPNKATRWMGPVLGPVARTVLLKNIAAHKTLGKIFAKAGQVRKVRMTEKEVQQALTDVRKMYRDQANNLYDQADKLQEARDELGQQLVGGDISLDDYQKQVVAIDKIIDINDRLADELHQKADNFRTSHVTKMIGKNLLKNLLGEVKNIITQETSNEIIKLVNPNIIDNILSRGGEVDALLDVLITGDLSEALKGEKSSIDIDALKDRIKDKIKQAVQDHKDELNKNWKTELQNIINETIKEIKETKPEDLKTKETEETEETEETKKEPPQFTLDEDGCRPGYKYKKPFYMCVQDNCSSIPDAHYSYEGYCVCGSSGSIEEDAENDPNKECSYTLEKSDCPGCVYACVNVKEDCPLEGIGEY